VWIEFFDKFLAEWHQIIKALHTSFERGHGNFLLHDSSKAQNALYPELYFDHVAREREEFINSSNLLSLSGRLACPIAKGASANDCSLNLLAPAYLSNTQPRHIIFPIDKRGRMIYGLYRLIYQG
jgi:hypothetical protein